MGFDVADFVPLLRVDLHDVFHHVLGLLVDVAGHEVLARQDLFVQLVCIRVLKGKITDSHGVEDNSEGPQVRVKSTVALPSNHLWRGVAGAATGRFERVVLVLVGVAEAEVDNFNVHVLVEE